MSTEARSRSTFWLRQVVAASVAQNGRGTVETEMSSEPIEPKHDEDRELPVEELLRRARPLPPHEQMVIEDLTGDEGEAFLAALHS